MKTKTKRKLKNNWKTKTKKINPNENHTAVHQWSSFCCPTLPIEHIWPIGTFLLPAQSVSNSLLVELRNPDISIGSFRQSLKTWLFSRH